MPLRARDLRHFAIVNSLFPPTTLAKAVARLGFVQADPIAAPARAQDLILRQRVEGYRMGDLERRYPSLALEEDYLHVYGFLPRTMWGLLHPRRDGGWMVEREYPRLAEQVLAFVRAQGEIDSRQLEKPLGNMRTGGGWTGDARATTRILEMLHYRGQVRVTRREGNVRRFSATTPAEPRLSPEERLWRLVALLVKQYQPVSEETLRYFVARVRNVAPDAVGRRTIISELVAAGRLQQGVVDGLNYYWIGERPEGEAKREVRWLAPFDPVVWDRPRFEHLWGWPYRFEAYTPAPKRRWGYYAHPMLWGQEIIGWATTQANGGELQVTLGFVGARPTGRAFKQAVEEERARLEAFLAPSGYRVVVIDGK